MALVYSLAELLEKLVNSPNDARLYTSVRVGIERMQARVSELEAALQEKDRAYAELGCVEMTEAEQVQRFRARVTELEAWLRRCGEDACARCEPTTCDGCFMLGAGDGE